MTHYKTRINRIDAIIDYLYENETGKKAHENNHPCAAFALKRFGIDQNELARIFLGFSDDFGYIALCESKLMEDYNK